MSLIAVPLGIIGLTRLGVLGPVEHKAVVRRIVTYVLTVSAPAAALLVVCATPVVGLLFGRGRVRGG